MRQRLDWVGNGSGSFFGAIFPHFYELVSFMAKTGTFIDGVVLDLSILVFLNDRPIKRIACSSSLWLDFENVFIPFFMKRRRRGCSWGTLSVFLSLSVRRFFFSSYWYIIWFQSLFRCGNHEAWPRVLQETRIRSNESWKNIQGEAVLTEQWQEDIFQQPNLLLTNSKILQIINQINHCT